MALNNGEAENREKDEIFDKCYLCCRWWWQRGMKHIRVPDQEGFIRKYICAECFTDVNGRSYQVLAGQK